MKPNVLNCEKRISFPFEKKSDTENNFYLIIYLFLAFMIHRNNYSSA